MSGASSSSSCSLTSDGGGYETNCVLREGGRCASVASAGEVETNVLRLPARRDRVRNDAFRKGVGAIRPGRDKTQGVVGAGGEAEEEESRDTREDQLLTVREQSCEHRRGALETCCSRRLEDAEAMIAQSPSFLVVVSRRRWSSSRNRVLAEPQVAPLTNPRSRTRHDGKSGPEALN